MGVKGLWQILESEGVLENCEVELTSLKGKVLAVDVSIWLYQFVKSVPAGKDSALSPLVIGGLFQRVCKLLHFGIKPIFVFDGTAPALKKETIAARHDLKQKGDSDYTKLARKILKNKLKLMALEEIASSKEDSSPSNINSKSTINDAKAPPIDFLTVLESREDSEDEDEDYAIQYDNSSDSYDVDINSKEFKKLPYDLQEQILLESRKRTIDTSQISEILSGNQSPESPKKGDSALDFSKAQVEALIKRRKLMDDLESLRGNSVKKATDSKLISHGRIASSSDKKYIFAKNAQAGWTLSLTDADANDKKDEDDVDSFFKQKKEKESSISDIEDDAEFMKMMFGDSVDESCSATSNKPEIASIPSNQSIPVQIHYSSSSASESEEEFDICVPVKKTVQSSTLMQETNYSLSESEEDVSPFVSPKLITEATVKLPEIILKDLIHVPEKEKAPESSNIKEVLDFVLSSSSSESDIEDLDPEYKNFIEEVSHKVTNDKSADFKDLVDKLQNELREFNTLSEASTITSVSPTKVLIDAFMEMLHHFKLPFIIAPFEAEAQCVAIKGTNGVISDDSDCLLFGAEAVYKGFFGSGAVSKKSKKSSSGVTKITMSKIEDITGLSRNDLIVLAHLLGCDYCTGVEGIGPKRALELVRQVKASDPLESLQKIVNLSENNESKYQKWLKGKISNNFIDARITQAFLNPIVTPLNVEDLKWGKFDLINLQRFMSIHAKWAKDKTASFLNDIEKRNK